MEGDTLTPTSPGAAGQIVNDTPMFYVVSKTKLSLLFVATLGLYAVYWFYKNWDHYKDNTPYASEVGSTVWPVPRAVFSVFFVHSLFRKVKAYGQDKPALSSWSNNLHATLLVILLLASNILDRAANKSIGSPYTDYLSLLILAPLLIQFLKAQEMINISCNDPEGVTNSRLSKANTAWLVVGSIFWILIVIGMFLPDPSPASL